MGYWLVVVALGGVACGTNDRDAADLNRKCSRMRDHLIEMRLDTVVEKSPALREQHRAALIAALGANFAEDCARTMSPPHVDCVLAARDSDAANACAE